MVELQYDQVESNLCMGKLIEYTKLLCMNVYYIHVWHMKLLWDKHSDSAFIGGTSHGFYKTFLCDSIKHMWFGVFQRKT